MDDTDVRDDVAEFDPEQGPYRAHFDVDAAAPSLAIVDAIASAEGTDPASLDPIGHTVDPEALDATLQSASDDSAIHVALPYHGYQVVVGSDGVIELRPIDPTSPDTREE